MLIALCQLSGGLDSTAALCLTLQKKNWYQKVYPIFIDSGAIYSNQEWFAALYISRTLAKKYEALQPLIIKQVSLEQVQQSQVSPYVPLRNLVYGSICANVAIAMGVGDIIIGNKTTEVRLNDPYCFRDCTERFFYQLQATVVEGMEPNTLRIRFLAPLAQKHLTKVKVMEIVSKEGIDLSQVWSCYGGGNTPCGKCYHCEENKKAVEQLGLSL